MLVQYIEEKGDDVFGLAYCSAPFFRVFRYEIGGIWAFRKLRHLYIEPTCKRRARGSPCRFDTGGICIKREHKIVRHTADQCGMIFRKCSARDGDRISPPRLMAHKEVHLPFYQDSAAHLAHRDLGAIESVEDAGFVEKGRFGRIQILRWLKATFSFRRLPRGRRLYGENATRKGDDAPCGIGDRKHNAVAELIVETPS